MHAPEHLSSRDGAAAEGGGHRGFASDFGDVDKEADTARGLEQSDDGDVERPRCWTEACQAESASVCCPGGLGPADADTVEADTEMWDCDIDAEKYHEDDNNTYEDCGEADEDIDGRHDEDDRNIRATFVTGLTATVRGEETTPTAETRAARATAATRTPRGCTADQAEGQARAGAAPKTPPFPFTMTPT